LQCWTAPEISIRNTFVSRIANFPSLHPEIPSNLPSLQRWRIVATSISHRFSNAMPRFSWFRKFKSPLLRWIKPREDLNEKRERKRDNNCESRNSLFAVHPTIAIPISSPFPPALCKQIGLSHQLDECLRNSSIQVHWYGGCNHESGNEWLRPWRNGSDMTHRHFLVSSCHSAGRIESARVFIDSCTLGCLLPCVCTRFRRKGEISTFSELARLSRTPRIATLFLYDEWNSLLRHCANILGQVFYSDLTNETRPKNCWLLTTSREFLCE